MDVHKRWNRDARHASTVGGVSDGRGSERCSDLPRGTAERCSAAWPSSGVVMNSVENVVLIASIGEQQEGGAVRTSGNAVRSLTPLQGKGKRDMWRSGPQPRGGFKAKEE